MSQLSDEERDARRRLADELARFMRGEITFSTAAEHWGELRKLAGPDALTSLPGGPLELAAHHKAADATISASAAEWEKLKRTLAFLESDLRLNRVVNAERGPSKLLLLPIVCAALLVAAVWGLLFGWGLGALAAGWIATGVVVLVVARRARGAGRRPPSRAGEFEWYPFNDEQQWLAHTDLLQRFTLPAYSTAIHDRRLPSGLTGFRALRAVAYTALGSLSICLLVSVLVPIYVLLIPVFALLMFRPIQTGRLVAMMPDEMARASMNLRSGRSV